MDLLEYQGKQLFARHGIPVPTGEPARSVEEAVAAANRIGYPCAVKAQVQIGGRGKLGGIKIAQDEGQAREHAAAILGMDIKGLTVQEVWIEGASEIAAEYYASFVFDRSAKAPLAMFSTRGGMDIEAVAQETPEAIATLHIDPLLGFQAFHGRRLAYGAGVDADLVRPLGAFLERLYGAFVAEEAMLVEVNPLIVTPERTLVALDAKVTLDGNSLYRHPDNAQLRDLSSEDPQERMAKERDLTYVKLDGDIGILGNGAGLVMSTLDVVARHGGHPGELPRRRWRGQGGGDHGGGRGDHLGPRREGRAVQHLWRHHPLRRGRARADRGLRSNQADDSLRGAPRRHQRRGGARASWPPPRCPTSTPTATMDEAAARVVELAQ